MGAPKNIVVVAEDSMNLQEKTNMNTKMPKMIHEQIFEEYKIDPQKVFERTGILKNIPIEWIPDIIENNISMINMPLEYKKINKKEKAIILVFNSEDICNQFYSLFGRNMAKAINNFIQKQNEDPKKYNRILTIETTQTEKQLIIRY